MMMLAKKSFFFALGIGGPITSNVTLPFGVMVGLMLLEHGLQAPAGQSCISNPVRTLSLHIENKMLLMKFACIIFLLIFK